MKPILGSLLLGGIVLLATASPLYAPPAMIESVEHTPDQPLPGQDVTFDVVAWGFEYVDLYYRLGDSGDFTIVNTVMGDPGYYSRTIDGAAFVDGDRIEYYVAAVHSGKPTVVTDPGDAPASVHAIDYVFDCEVLGIYFDEVGESVAISTTSDNELVEVTLAILNPHMWDLEKGRGSARQWQCQVRVEGTIDGVSWAWPGTGVNNASKKDIDPVYPFDITYVDYEGAPLDDGRILRLATLECTVPTPSTQIRFYIEPWDDPGAQFANAPGYSPDGYQWRMLGTSSGGDPNDPSPDWSGICAVINGVEPVRNSNETWSGVKALFR